MDKLESKNFTSSVKRILARTDMLATSSLENLKDTSLQGSSNSGYLVENQRLRGVDPDVVVVVLVKVEVVVFEISEVDRRKSRRVRKQQKSRRSRVVLFLIIL